MYVPKAGDIPRNAEEFNAYTDRLMSMDSFVMPRAYAFGVATMVVDPKVEGGARLLEAKFPWGVNFDANAKTAAVMTDFVGPLRSGYYELSEYEIGMALNAFAWLGDEPGHKNVDAIKALSKIDTDTTFLGHYKKPILAVVTDLDVPPVDAGEAYLRLHLPSMRHVLPRTMNLDGMFDLLSNCCWTSHGVFDATRMDEVRQQVIALGHDPLQVSHQDKFPRLLDYYSPPGVRIGDGSRVRLGAYLAEGTTVMHEGFVNFNAGTLGKCMVEGRISAGVVVGAYSDIGGGASIMGTLSGGNNIVVSIGQGCLLEAESGLGIPIGDRVRVAVGHYVKDTSRVRIELNNFLWRDNGLMTGIVSEYRGGLSKGPEAVSNYGFIKASELTGINDAIFRRNDVDGASEVVPRGDSTWGSLNAMLHNN